MQEKSSIIFTQLCFRVFLAVFVWHSENRNCWYQWVSAPVFVFLAFSYLYREKKPLAYIYVCFFCIVVGNLLKTRKHTVFGHLRLKTDRKQTKPESKTAKTGVKYVLMFIKTS